MTKLITFKLEELRNFLSGFEEEHLLYNHKYDSLITRYYVDDDGTIFSRVWGSRSTPTCNWELLDKREGDLIVGRITEGEWL